MAMRIASRIVYTEDEAKAREQLRIFGKELLKTFGIALMIGYILMAFCYTAMVYAEEETRYAICNPGNKINIRASATTHSDIIGYLYAGDAIETDGETKTDNQNRLWVHIPDAPCDVSDGWVCARYLVEDKIEVATFWAIIESNGRVAARDGANGNRNGWVQPGQQVEVYAMSTEWAVTNKGFIKAEYIREVTP